jgi:hypothetical protein
VERYLKLGQGQLVAATPTAVYTCPVGYSAVIRHIRLVNTTGAAREVSLRQGGNDLAHAILPTTSITAGGWGEFDGTIMLAGGEVLYGHSDAASAITYSIYGLEVET